MARDGKFIKVDVGRGEVSGRAVAGSAVSRRSLRPYRAGEPEGRTKVMPLTLARSDLTAARRERARARRVRL
jgi:hypothetical protein